VCAPASPIVLSSNLSILSYASHAQKASLFSGAEHIKPSRGPRALTFRALISRQIKALPGTYAHAEAWQAVLGIYGLFCPASRHLLTGLHSRFTDKMRGLKRPIEQDTPGAMRRILSWHSDSGCTPQERCKNNTMPRSMPTYRIKDAMLGEGR
jgi:hypothetical protein